MTNVQSADLQEAMAKVNAEIVESMAALAAAMSTSKQGMPSDSREPADSRPRFGANAMMLTHESFVRPGQTGFGGS